MNAFVAATMNDYDWQGYVRYDYDRYLKRQSRALQSRPLPRLPSTPRRCPNDSFDSNRPPRDTNVPTNTNARHQQHPHALQLFSLLRS